MKKTEKNTDATSSSLTFGKMRSGVIFIAFLLVAIYIAGNLSILQVVEASEWQAKANEKQLVSATINPKRGTIYDSEMRELAESAPVWTISIAPNLLAKSALKNTAELDPARLAAQQLAALLELDEETIYQNISDKESLYYPINVKMSRELTDQVEALYTQYGLRGISTIETSKRYYPYEDMAASVLGFMNSDGTGVYGLEAQYEDILKGTPGRTISSRAGEIPGEVDSKTYPAEDGGSLVTTINVDIQQSLEEHLSAAVAKYNATERGMGIVMDVNTGAILAMATKGDFNPNDPYYISDETLRNTIEAMPDGDEKTQARANAWYRQWRNKAIADTYEPGSVLKVITAAAALDSGTYTADSLFTCTGAYDVADRTIGCAGGVAHGTITLREALIVSCNISFIQVAQGLGVSTWYDYINAFGLTEPTGIDLPSEPSQNSLNTVVYSENAMGPVQLASCAFGQSNKYTALQMITAVSTAVNGGNLVQPHLVSEILDAQGNVTQEINPSPKRQVVSEETSAALRGIMEDLVSNTSGSGRNAYVAGYHVGGKSGTSQKLELLAEDETNEKYISSFVGFAPANDPQIAVLIVLDEPHDDSPLQNYFGGRLAGPTVGSVISETVKILGIAPDYESGEMTRTTISTPNLLEKDVSSDIVTLNGSGLSYKTMGSGATVLGQYPTAGSPIPRGGQVILYTDGSVLEQRTVMPDLSSKNAKVAIDTLRSLGLNVLAEGASEDGGNVVVISQSVEAGQEIPLGTVVTLTFQDVSAITDH
ncbi:MAG: penicillin-binding transpeptidase domain-containing protein [Oscillospiraceae bacterium]